MLMWKAISSCPPTRQSTTHTIVNIISRDVVMHVEEKKTEDE